MMRPVFLYVLVVGMFLPTFLNAKTLIFQSQSEQSPEQVVATVVQANNAPQALLTTHRQAASANSELFFMLEQLQQEIRYLRGTLEEQANQLHHLRLNSKNRYKDLDARVLDLSKKMSGLNSVTPVSVVPIVTTVTAPVLNADALPLGRASNSNQVPKLVFVPPSDEQKHEYQQAYSLIKKKKFDDAIEKFHLFIEHYPEGNLAGNAYYWLGEVYLVLPKLEQARQAFSVVVSAFPKHRKVADAMFKLGVSYDRLQDPAKSEQYLNEVQLKFPDSTAAKLAKSYKINR